MELTLNSLKEHRQEFLNAGYKLPEFDIVTTSPTGPGAFEGEEELFPTSWREYDGE